jgi:hypothetical protein
MAKRWGPSDDAKLTQLWRTPHSGVDHTKLDHHSVKAVQQDHFPTRKYSSFAPLYRNKARSFGVSLSLEGHRKSKGYHRLLHRCFCCSNLLFLLS